MDRVVLSGATLASIVHGLAAVETDGLLLGRLEQRSTAVYSDAQGDDGQVSRNDSCLVVTGFRSAGRLLSFYDGTGAVDINRVQLLLGSLEGEIAGKVERKTDASRSSGAWVGSDECVIGWFVRRANSPLQPSMREAAVTAQLDELRQALQSGDNQRLQGDQGNQGASSFNDAVLLPQRDMGQSSKLVDLPLKEWFSKSTRPVLCIFNSQWDFTRSTSTFHYLSYTLSPETPPQSPLSIPYPLSPLPVSVANLGLAHRPSFPSFLSASLPPVQPCAITTGQAYKDSDNSSKQSQWEELQNTGREQVFAFEAAYEGLLMRLEASAAAAVESTHVLM